MKPNTTKYKSVITEFRNNIPSMNPDEMMGEDFEFGYKYREDNGIHTVTDWGNLEKFLLKALEDQDTRHAMEMAGLQAQIEQKAVILASEKVDKVREDRDREWIGALGEEEEVLVSQNQWGASRSITKGARNKLRKEVLTKMEITMPNKTIK